MSNSPLTAETDLSEPATKGDLLWLDSKINVQIAEVRVEIARQKVSMFWMMLGMFTLLSGLMTVYEFIS